MPRQNPRREKRLEAFVHPSQFLDSMSLVRETGDGSLDGMLHGVIPLPGSDGAGAPSHSASIGRYRTRGEYFTERGVSYARE